MLVLDFLQFETNKKQSKKLIEKKEPENGILEDKKESHLLVLFLNTLCLHSRLEECGSILGIKK